MRKNGKKMETMISDGSCKYLLRLEYSMPHNATYMISATEI